MNQTQTHARWMDAPGGVGVLLVCLVVVATAVYLPLVLNYPSYIKDFLLQSAACVLLLLWAARTVCGGGRWASTPLGFLRRFLPEILLGCLILLGFVSASWSGLPYVVTLGAFTVGFRVAWGLVVGGLDWQANSLKAILGAIVLAGFTAALTTLILFWTGDSDFDSAVVGHRNFLASFLIPPIVLVCIVALRWRPAGSARAVWLAVNAGVLAVLLYAFALCKSNGAEIGLAASGGFVLLVCVRAVWRRRLLVDGGILALVAVIGLVFTWPQVRPWLVRSQQATRYFHAIGSFQMFRARPFLGWGTETFLSRYPHFRPVEAGRYGWMDQLTLHPHNEYVAVAIRTGLVGLALFVGALGLTVLRAVRTLPTHPHRWLLVGIVASAVGMMVHGLFDVQLSFWGAGGMFWTLIGLLLSFGRPASDIPSRPRSKPRAMGLAVLCACAGSVALLWWEVPLQGLLAENRLARANDARAHGKLAHAQALYQETIARSRYVPDYVLPHAYLADCLIQTAGAKESASARAAGLGEAARALEELRLLAPDLYLVDTNLGKTYMALAREAMEPSPAAPEDSLRARLYAERAAAMFNAQVTVRPYHMTLPRRRLAEALHTLSHGYLPLCIEQLRGVLALDPLDAPARYLLGQYLSEKGELSEAVCQLEVSSALRKKLMARQVKRWVVALVACDFQAVHRALSLADFQAKAIAQAECSLARVLHAMQADEQACRHLAEALRFWPKCPEAEVLLHTLSPPKEGA